MFAYDIPNEIELHAVPNGIPVGKWKYYSSKFKSLFNASFNASTLPSPHVTNNSL